MPNIPSSGGKPIICRCPKCKKEHKIKIALEIGNDNTSRLACEWTGKGVPRIYCQACKKALGIIYGGNFPRLEYDIITEGKL
jgi:hypothetical protein